MHTELRGRVCSTAMDPHPTQTHQKPGPVQSQHQCPTHGGPNADAMRFTVLSSSRAIALVGLGGETPQVPHFLPSTNSFTQKYTNNEVKVCAKVSEWRDSPTKAALTWP